VQVTGLSQSPVKDAVDAGDRTRSERTMTVASRPQQIPEDVVDVGGRQLVEIEVTDMRLQVTIDDRSGVTHGGRRPTR